MACSGDVVDVGVAEPTRSAPGATTSAPAAVEEQSTPIAVDYLLPIGPLCPYRSHTMEGRNVDNEIAVVAMQAAQFEPEFTKFGYVIQAGLPVDKTKALALGLDIVTQSENLRRVLDEIEFSKDFQATESYYLTNVSCQRLGTLSTRNIQEYMQWQGTCLQDLATGKQMPPPPEAVRAMLESEAPAPSPAPMGAPPVRCMPFGTEDFKAISQSEEARSLEAEYERLKRDHEMLLRDGESYGSFGPAGKWSYLEKMDSITARWEELIASFLAAGGILSPGFLHLSATYLHQTRSTAEDFRSLVKGTHDLMREMASRQD